MGTRVLLVEDNPVDARLLQEALATAGDARFELQVANRLSDGLTRIAAFRPDVIVLDLILPDSRGYDTFSAVKAHAPGVPVLLLTGLGDEELGLRAVREGAQDFLVKSDTARRGLVRAILYAIERQRTSLQQPRASRKVVACMGAKGGVGTTTTALNVAAALARHSSVTLVELRGSRGTLADHLNLEPVKNLATLLIESRGDLVFDLMQDHMCKLPYGLKVLFGPQHPEEFQAVSADAAEALIEQIAATAQYVLIDLAGDASAADYAAIVKSDLALVVTDAEPVSVAAAQASLKLLRFWGVSALVTGIVVVDRGAVVSPLRPADISARLRCEVLASIPPLRRSGNRGGPPVVLTRPSSRTALALAALAQRVSAASPVPTST